MNIDEMVDLLRKQERLKILSAQELANFLCLNVGDIYYSYMKNLIPLQGVTNNGMSFLFHGQECYVKAYDWDIELELGPKGEIRGFDKYRICHMFGYKVDKCHDLIKTLEESRVIKLIDPDLFLLSSKPSLKELIFDMPENRQIDLGVADRYILTS